jgi:hypothetical protein
MTGLTTQPQLLASAAADASEISSTIGAAKAAAAGPTTSLAAAAEDEVSAVAAPFFGAYGQEYQALLQRAAAFHDQFVAALSAAGNAYAGAETTASNMVRTFEADALALLAGNAGPAVSNATGTISVPAPTLPGDPVYTLVLGARGLPIPPPEYIEGIPPLYINPFFGACTNIGIITPEGLYPLTGIKDLTFDISVARGLTVLNNAIQQYATLGGTANTLNVFGYSQSAAIASLEMQALNPTNTPGGACYPPACT